MRRRPSRRSSGQCRSHQWGHCTRKHCRSSSARSTRATRYRRGGSASTSNTKTRCGGTARGTGSGCTRRWGLLRGTPHGRAWPNARRTKKRSWARGPAHTRGRRTGAAAHNQRHKKAARTGGAAPTTLKTTVAPLQGGAAAHTRGGERGAARATGNSMTCGAKAHWHQSTRNYKACPTAGNTQGMAADQG